MSEIRKALVKALAELENPPLDATNPHFRSRYVSLAGLIGHVKPVLVKHGLTVLQPLVETGVLTVILHESGEELVYGPVVLPMVKADPQAAGSAITYARRYALAAVLGICGEEDDDANAASQKADHSTPKTQAAPAPKAPQKAPQGSAMRISRVDRKEYRKKDGSSGTRYVVALVDGPLASTFSDTIGKHAERHAKDHSPCSPILVKKGDYTNLDGFSCCAEDDVPDFGEGDDDWANR